MHRRIRIVILLLVVALLGGWAAYAYMRSHRASDDGVVASGTIEAEQVIVASQIPGRIEHLHADEGDVVSLGATLVTLQGREVLAQVDQARAAVDAAQARVDQARAALRAQARQVDAQIAQAEAAADAARAREEGAAETQTLSSAQLELAARQAETALAAARDQSVGAKAARDQAGSDLARAEALFREGAVSAQQVDAARTAFASAEAQYAVSLDMVAQAEAALGLARENQGQVAVRGRETAATRAQVQQAEATVRAARAGGEIVAQRRADVDAAEAQVRQAEANLRYLLAQQQNLAIAAPTAGIIVSRQASEGEVINPGAPILTIADLSRVWVRVYIPLPELGAVSVGQRAEVTTDALPGRTFTGTVTEISQQAEFTPGNVQTREQRVKQVFAVKISLANPERLLKPGMPADAIIATSGITEP